MRTIVRNSYTPKVGDYCDKIVVDEDTGTQYIFDCDGVYTTYTSKQQEGAPMFYVDSRVTSALNEAKSYADAQDQIILQQAKDYTDEHGGGGGGGDVTKAYVDAQDTNVLNSAKAYADEKDVTVATEAASYTDGEIADLKTELEGEITGAMNELAPVATSGEYDDLANKPIVPVINLTSTDPGEGTALAANTFIGVYNG